MSGRFPDGAARTPRHMGVADRRGVGDDRADLIVVDSQGLGRHQRHRGARAADIDAAAGDDDGAILVDLNGGARFAAAVEPIRRGHIPPGRRTAGLELEPTLGGGNRAVLLDANLDAHHLPPRPCCRCPRADCRGFQGVSRVRGAASAGARSTGSASEHFVDLRFEVRWRRSSRQMREWSRPYSPFRHNIGASRHRPASGRRPGRAVKTWR
jgi:hypothetical protein